MDKPPRSGKKIEVMLKETLFEISQGKIDPFHKVVTDVLEDINAAEGPVNTYQEKEKSKPE
jgi:hypothetical protein